ncbi:alpha/beta hydrolase family protein [Eudoraea sp.]|uniref:alpha/beta hydrolase family protein n=1 Tax=Eudoraea sp. TaxID=1979955 RepID=UPI003C73DF0F
MNSFETDLIQEKETEGDVIKKQDLSFTSNGLKLYGTLWEPKNSIQKGLFFVTSSQGNDRSGTNAEASYFADLGYTVFNYDKRGTGKSEGNWQSATIEELCSDDINAIAFFAKATRLPLSEIGIKGSSQGGIKIPYILTKMPELKFGISISCPSGTLLESDLNYWKNTNVYQVGQENIIVAEKVQKAGYDYLANNLSYKKLNSIKNKYVNQDWFKYVWIPEENITKDYKLNFSGIPYFKKISQPILVIQGQSDIVIPGNSYKIIEKALKKSESKKYEILTLDNTTHSMTYLDKEFPYFQTLSPKYLVSITEWLKIIEN